ncbi:MAG TPA: hypothetical protein VNK41_00675, partial [Vicinamibacterales bacterium]|nr:hypothetical protein [Vicinamibacterales bacterium]
ARALSFTIRIARVEGPLLRAARFTTQPVAAGAIAPLPTRHGAIRSRVFRPLERIERAVILVPGVHAMGVEEPRLAFLSTELAASGIAVAAIELPDLMRFELTPRTVDMIEDAARWLSERRDLATDGRIGLIGVSFAGGLSIVAAGRPTIRDRLAFVFSLGGHGDVERTLRYLCTGIEPAHPDDGVGAAGRRRTPHDYGVAILLLRFADRLVPPEQVAPLRGAILTFLRASHLDVIDKPAAAPVFAAALEQEHALPEPARTLMHFVNTRNVTELGPRLLPVLEQTAFDPSLSPERSDPPAAPVYLLHGVDDQVIPSVETRRLARHLESRTRVRVLLTPLISHAQTDGSQDPIEVFRLVRFWAAMLEE